MPKNWSFQIITLTLLASLVLETSCTKNYLDKKPSTDLVVPSTLVDFQALLDEENIMQECPILGELSSDDFYLLSSLWSPLNTKEHNAYIWAQDIYGGQGGVDDWDLPYEQVFYGNVVLEGLQRVTRDTSNASQWYGLQGSALFIRAYAFYNLAQVFAPVYDNAKSATDPYGIPLRLSSDVNPVSVRSTVEQTYDRIIADLQTATALLSPKFPTTNRNRPSKPAALAMLARVYLSMRDYVHAGIYADSCLQLYSTLIDYNTLNDTTTNMPIIKTNLETMYQSRLLTNTKTLLGFATPGCIVDSVLFNSYDSSDLRRKVFYKINSAGNPNCKDSYNGSIFSFSGLATDEVYLIRAECFARAGNTTAALNDLDTLLVNRWKTGSFVPVTASNATQALALILAERRKELAFRGIRWTDLRRLNKEGAAIGIARNINGQSYQLLPNSIDYVLPIPPDVIHLSGMPQNPR